MRRQDVTKLSRTNRWDIYFHYSLVTLGLKHKFHVRDTLSDPINYGWGPYDKVVGNIEFRYLWSNIYQKTFEEFDNENDLWEWYWRFKDEIAIQMDSQTH